MKWALYGYVTDRRCEPDFSVLIHGQLLSAFFPYDEVMAVARYSWERNLTLCLADFVIDSDLCLAPRNNAVQFHLAVGIGRFRGLRAGCHLIGRKTVCLFEMIVQVQKWVP